MPFYYTCMHPSHLGSTGKFSFEVSGPRESVKMGKGAGGGNAEKSAAARAEKDEKMEKDGAGFFLLRFSSPTRIH